MTLARTQTTLNFLVRFSDGLRGVNTFEEHRRIESKHGTVWLGKFGLGAGHSILEIAAEQIGRKIPTGLYLMAGKTILFEAIVLDIKGVAPGAKIPAPEPALVPAYYRSERCALWFKVARLRKTETTAQQLRLFFPPGLPPQVASSRGMMYVTLSRN